MINKIAVYPVCHSAMQLCFVDTSMWHKEGQHSIQNELQNKNRLQRLGWLEVVFIA